MPNFGPLNPAGSISDELRRNARTGHRLHKFQKLKYFSPAFVARHCFLFVWLFIPIHFQGHSSNVKVLKPVPLVIRTQSADEIAGAVAHPTKPSEIRKLIRSKMVRCRICRNRFLDKHIYERHLRDRHPKEHAAYLSQQEDEVRQQRLSKLKFETIELGSSFEKFPSNLLRKRL